jgi:putative colanic acid biosynthesis acetyltransferase WcaF
VSATREDSPAVDLSHSSNRGYEPGRPFLVRALWLLVQALVFLNPVVTSYRLKTWVLRLFGAQVGRGLVIKPGVHVKYPWQLWLGDQVWLGERCWIDNFVPVRIESNAVVSQGAYLCTGNHDWSDPGMGLVVRPVTIRSGAWVAAFARVAPGVEIKRNAVVGFGAVLVTDAEEDTVYMGSPAEPVSTRRVGPEA